MKKIFFTILIILEIVILVLSFSYKNKKIQDIFKYKKTAFQNNLTSTITNFENHLSMIYQISLNEMLIDDINENIYKAHIDTANVSEYRQKIYKSFKPKFDSMKRYGFSEVNFFFDNGKVLLRMNNPEMYGDQIKHFKFTAANTLDNKKPSEGFELGKTFAGYRFTYPSFYKGKFIGAVESGIRMKTVSDYLSAVFNGYFTSIIHKNDIDSLIITSKKENFRKCALFNDYYCDVFSETDLYGDYSDSIYIRLKEMKNKINIKQNELNANFKSVYFKSGDNNYYILQFLPIKSFNGKNIGYLINLKKEILIKNALDDFKRILFLTQIIMIILTAAVFLGSSMQSRIRKSDKRFKKMFMENTAIMLLIDEHSNKITAANRTAVEFFGYSEKELQNKTLNDLTPDLKGISNIEIKSHEVILKQMTKKGELKYVQLNVTPIETDNKIFLFSIIYDITEKIQSDRELVKNKNKLQLAQSIAQLGNWEIDINSGEIYWSDEMYNIVGVKKHNYILSSETSIPSSNSEQSRIIALKINEAIAECREFDYEYALTLKGETIYVYLKGSVYYDEDGVPSKLLGILQDITDQKIIELQLKKEKSFSNTLIDKAPNLILVLNEKGIIERCNYKFEEYSEYSKDELYGSYFWDKLIALSEKEKVSEIFPVDSDEKLMKLREYFNSEITEKNTNFSFELFSKSEKKFIIKWYGANLRNDKNKIEHFVLMGIDMTKQIKAENELIKERNFTKAIVENIPELILVTDTQGNVIELNKNGEVLTGFTADELKGKKFWDYIVPEDEREIHSKNYVYQDHSMTYSREGRLLTKEKKIKFIDIKTGPVYNEKNEIEYIINTASDITERKKIEQQLEKERNLNSAIIDNTPHLVMVLNKNGQIIQLNKGGEKLTGYKFNELQGKYLWQVLTPYEFKDEYMEAFKDVDFTVPFTHERYIKTKSGDLRLHEVSTAPIHDKNGNLEYTVSLGIDITEKRTALNQLKEEKRFSNTIVETAPAMIILTSREGNIIQFNKEAEKTTGLKFSDVRNEKIWNDLITDSFDPDIRKIISEDFTQIPNDIVFEIETKDKEKRLIEWSNSVVQDTDDEPFVISIGIDITEERAAENALKESEEKFRQIAEKIDEVFFLRDKKEIIYISPSYELVWEQPVINALKKPGIFLDSVHPEDKERVKDIFEKSLKEGKVEYQYRIVTPSGNVKWIHSKTYPIYNENKEIVRIAGIAENITEIKEYEERLKIEKEKAEAGSRAKSEFLVNMSHEIRTPMNGVLGMTDLLLDSELENEQYEYLKMIKTSANSLLNIINDILDFSKIESGKLEIVETYFELQTIVYEVVDTVAVSAYEKDIELIPFTASDVPKEIYGDSMRIKQILLNLLSNAVKFTEKGEVILNVYVKDRTEEKCELIFKISDSGAGIPEDKKNKLFKSFSQADSSISRKHGGTGLGLVISKKLSDLMNGSIWFESEENKGSDFYFSLICDYSTPKQEEKSIDLSQVKILLIEKNNKMEEFIVKMLSEHSADITHASSALQGFSILKATHRSNYKFDIIMIDVQQNLGCSEFLERISVYGYSSEDIVLIVNSYNKNVDIKQCRNHGIGHFIFKPVKKLEMVETILDNVYEYDSKFESYRRQKLYSEPESDPELDKLNILAAEDNLISRKLVKTLLKKRGWSVETAGSGVEAVEKFRNGSFNLVLMDIQMPEMDGLEASRRIRKIEEERGGHCVIIAMTAHAVKGYKETCLDAGMDDYLSKPVSAKALYEAVDRNFKVKFVERERRQTVIDPIVLDRKITEEGPPPASLDDLLKMIEYNMDLFNELCGVLLETLPAELEDIKTALESGNMDIVHKRAHKLKSTVGNFRAARALELFFRLEIAGKEKRLEEAKEIYVDAEAESIRLIRYVKEFMKKNS